MYREVFGSYGGPPLSVDLQSTTTVPYSALNHEHKAKCKEYCRDLCEKEGAELEFLRSFNDVVQGIRLNTHIQTFFGEKKLFENFRPWFRSTGPQS